MVKAIREYLVRCGWLGIVLLIFAAAILGQWLDTIYRLHRLLPHGANW